MDKKNPFDIPKVFVWKAFKLVKANKGSSGVDEESLTDFEQNLTGNLYKLWNRLSSGTYFPRPVKGVAIPKKQGGSRILGIPTVADRIAQMTMHHKDKPWCRYADDGIAHCRTEQKAKQLLDELKQRFSQCGLELHPD